MSNPLNITTAAFGGLREVTTAPLWQWDYGQILEITGLDLPQAFEVHFSNSRKSGETITQIGTDSQVVIPDMYLTSGADIYAFIFLHDGTDDGETEYVIKIPVRERPEPSDIEPTPEQQDAITEAIAALNDAVEQTGEDKAATAALAEAAAASSLVATQAAEAAQGSATSASGSATTATNAANTATAKASEAATSAANAAQSAEDAESERRSAANYARSASDSAGDAVEAKTAAQQAANTATAKASEASTSASNASGSASAASLSASQASDSATSAANSATAAAGSVTTASTKASEASASATDAANAKTGAEAAQTAAETAQTAAEEARDKAEEAAASVSGELNNKADIIISNAEGTIATFEDGGDDMPMVSCVAKIEPVQSGSGDPSPDNVRPISGWTGVNLVRTGINILDVAQFVPLSRTTIDEVDGNTGKIAFTATTSYYGVRIRFPIQKFAGKKVAFSALWPTSPKRAEIRIYNASENIVLRVDASKDGTFTIPADAVTFQMTLSNSTTVNSQIVYEHLQLEVSDSVSAFEPFGTTYPISWQSEAGTVYGGTVDLVSGVLTVTHGEIDSYAGETLPSVWISDRDVYAEGATPTTGAQVVYKLATPITYQLTPTEVRTLLGLNNVWADTGDTEVEYRADTKLYIEKLTQPEEYDMIADSSITSGQFFMVGNTLYRALANIASGATITVGTNAQRVSLADALNLVNA